MAFKRFLKGLVFHVFLIQTFVSCIILNPLGVRVGRTSAADAKDKIFMAALTGEILISSALGQGGLGLKGLFYSTITDELAGIDGDKYYLTSSVDKCVDSIQDASILVIAAGSQNVSDTLEYKRVFTPVLVCNLEEDGVILGKPFPKI